jgi:hypothetical protein
MNLAEWLQGDHEPSQRLKAAASLCRAVTERAGGAGLSLDPSRIEVSADGECRPEAGKGAPPGRYRAPEIADGRPATPQSQVYTAGVLCFEILAGRAFEPRGAPLLRDVRPDLPRDLSDAVQACLEMDAEWRPKDLAYVLGLMEGMGPSTKAATPSARTRPSGVAAAPASRSARHGPAPRSWPLLAFAVLALAASIASAIVRLRQPPDAPALPPAPVAVPATTAAAPATEPSAVALGPAATTTDQTRPASAPAINSIPSAAASATPRPSRPSPSASIAAASVAPSAAAPVAATPAAATPAPTPAPIAAQPAEPAGPAAVTSVAPPVLRRGATVLVDVHGVGLRSDHQVRIGRGREAARGIEVVRQRYVSPLLLQALLKVDATAAPGAYVLSVVDATGQATNTRPLEVSR